MVESNDYGSFIDVIAYGFPDFNAVMTKELVGKMYASEFQSLLHAMFIHGFSHCSCGTPIWKVMVEYHGSSRTYKSSAIHIVQESTDEIMACTDVEFFKGLTTNWQRFFLLHTDLFEFVEKIMGFGILLDLRCLGGDTYMSDWDRQVMRYVVDDLKHPVSHMKSEPMEWCTVIGDNPHGPTLTIGDRLQYYHKHCKFVLALVHSIPSSYDIVIKLVWLLYTNLKFERPHINNYDDEEEEEDA